METENICWDAATFKQFGCWKGKEKTFKSVCYLYHSTSFFYIVCYFSGTHIHVCDFHREKAWSEWLSKADHGVSDMKSAVLEDLRRIATSADALTLGKNIQSLKESAAWQKSIHLQQYFNTYWGRHLTVSIYRPFLSTFYLYRAVLIQVCSNVNKYCHRATAFFPLFVNCILSL